MEERILPFDSSFLKRPRISRLLEDGLSCNLIALVAAPGYGKTQETAAFLSTRDIRLGWVRMTRLHNLPSYFWQSLVGALRQEFAVMAEKLDTLGFPDSLAKIDSFLHILSGDIYANKFSVLVIDDYDKIENREIKQIFEYLFEASLENFCLVMISRHEIEIDPVSLRSGGSVARIAQRELSFTESELREYYHQLQLSLTETMLKRIYTDTGGWPLMIHLLADQIRSDSNYRDSLDTSHRKVNHLFEREHFSAYPPPVKRLLVLLSTMSDFSVWMVHQLAGDFAQQLIQTLNSHVFVTYDFISGTYTYQNMYRQFLLEKQNLTTEEERNRALQIAGDAALQQGSLLDAIEFYSRCRRFDDMVDAIVRFIARHFAMSRSQGSFLLEKLLLIPDEAASGNNLADYCKACLYIQSLQPEEALSILQKMEARLTGSDRPGDKSMLGEVYERMAGIHMMYRKESFLDYYRKASELLPNGSVYKSKKMLRFKNFNIISTEDYAPGALERMETSLHDGIQYMIRVENSAQGFQHLFSTETAFATLNFDRAKQSAYRAIYDATTGNQHDIVCSAYYLLAKTACMLGNYADMTGHIESLRRYADLVDMQEINEIRDYADSWYYFQLGQTERIVPWIIAAQSGIASQMPLAIGREETLYAGYLLYCKRYDETISLLEQIKDWYMIKGWGDRINANILLSFAYQRQNNYDKARERLWDAYEMTYHNRILAPFIEGGTATCDLLQLVQKQPGPQPFDQEWLREVSQKALDFTKRTSRMAHEHKQAGAAAQTPLSPLSKRETDILRRLAQGQMREEIANEFHISMNTVKSHIRAIYNKLGAVNRADAVRIAIHMGIIERE